MNVSQFFLTLSIAFISVVILMPILSFVSLRNARIANAEFLKVKPMAWLFCLEVLMWLVAAFVVAFVLVMFLGFFVYVNAHAAVSMDVRDAENYPVALFPLMFVFGVIAGLAALGWQLHNFIKDKMIYSSRDNLTSHST